MRLQQAIEAFGRCLKSERNMAPRTIEAYLYDLGRLARWLGECKLGDPRVDAITNWQLKEFLAVLHEEHDLKPASMSRVVSSIRVFFEFLHTDGYVETNPARGLRSPKKGRRLPIYLPPDEARRLVLSMDPEHPDHLRDRTILVLLLMTGMRLSELTGLNRNDPSFEARTIKVLGKGRKERLVPMNRLAEAALRNWLAEGPSPTDGSNALFVNRRGERISKRTVQYIVHKAVKRAGLDPRISPHKLRHTFATTLYAEETDLRDIQELLGHANIASTSIYTHTNVDKVRAAVATLKLRSLG
ncbi:MAG: tyrosine recombinase XerC [Candidatus Sumerlaeia bacterium]|nr:tyrosine recombinase XerC [Candidatus Sumerlaeia bacterium]